MKIIVNYILKKLAYLLSMYYVAKFKLGFDYKDQAIAMSRLTCKLGYFSRRCFYKKTLAYCGEDLMVHFGAYITSPSTRLGNRVSIEENSIVSKATIGNNVIIASNVVLLSSGLHHEVDNLDVLFHDSILETSPINIGDNCWIGVNSTIMNDIASGSIVGAQSVLTKPITEENCLYVGVPAKLYRKRGV